jgi:predicted alpha/beta-hydrolase family hydrolase
MQARRGAEPRKKPPNREPVLRACWHAVIEELGGGAGLVIGGKSMGGRIASLIADEAGVAGLVCLGYPFHPPGRPEKLRTAHLAELRTPTLIVQGERDRLGGLDEVAEYTLSKAIELAWMPDGDHSFKPRVRSGRTEADNLADAIAAMARFVTGVG